MKSIIGEFYVPVDNLYAVNLSDPNQKDKDFLAGTYNSEASICKIITEPFTINVLSVLNKLKPLEMVIIERLSDNTAHMTMFIESGLQQQVIEQGFTPFVEIK